MDNYNYCHFDNSSERKMSGILLQLMPDFLTVTLIN